MSKSGGPVLLIDSRYDSRKLIKSTLHAIGHKDVRVVDSPSDGMELITQFGHEYELIISSLSSEDSESLNLVNDLPLFLQMQSIFIHSESDDGIVDEIINDIPGLNTLKRPFATKELEDMILKVAEARFAQRKADLLYKPLDEDSRILVIDDFETMRQLMRNAFIDLGYFNIDDSHNGVDAYHMIRKAYYENDPYQLIFADWNMPERNGYELLLMLQKDQLLKGAPFIMVTAENEKNQVITAISAGVDDYIVKPLNPKVLMKKLEKINMQLANRISIIKQAV